MKRFIIILTLIAFSCSHNPSEKSATQNPSPQDSTATIHVDGIVDTVLVGKIALPIYGGIQTVNCRLRGDNWNKPIYWQRWIMNGTDTVWMDSDTCSYYDYEIEQGTTDSERNSILQKKKNCLLTKMTIVEMESLTSDTEYFKISMSVFQDYYCRQGISIDSAQQIHRAFWNYYGHREIFMLSFYNPDPPGNEVGYVVDPYSRKIVPFYVP
jgi:hypothetical protein